MVPGDDLDAQVDLAERAFGVKSPEDRGRGIGRLLMTALLVTLRQARLVSGGSPADAAALDAAFAATPYMLDNF